MSDTQTEVNKQRAALLTAIAQQGTAGRTAYEAEQARQAEYAKAAAAAVAGSTNMTGSSVPPELLAEIRAADRAQQQVYSQDNRMALQNYTNSMNQTAMSNAAYMDQARAAVPVVEAQTRGTIAQIRAQQEEAARQRAFQREQEQWAREDRAYQLSQRDVQDNVDAQKFLQEGQAAKRESIGKRIYREDPANAKDVEAIVGTSETLGQAINLARSLVRRSAEEYNADKKHKTKISEGQIHASTNRIMRWLYLYYTGQDPEWHDAQTFGMQLRAQNVNPRHVYGYDPILGNRAGPAGIQRP